MNNNKLSDRLKELKAQCVNYQYIVDKIFNNPLRYTQEEIDIFINENKDKIEEFERIAAEIHDIEWRMMSLEEQQEYMNKYKED